MNSAPSLPTGLPRDRFEMLSAYLDGELTANERRQVETWLAEDPDAQGLYQRLLNLRRSFEALPPPTSACNGDQLAAQVLRQVDRRNRQRWLWRVGPIAAVVIGAWVGLGLRQNFGSQLTPQLAQDAASPTGQPEIAAPAAPASESVTIATDTLAADSLAIPLDQPIIAFPATAPEEVEAGSGLKSVKSQQPDQGYLD